MDRSCIIRTLEDRLCKAVLDGRNEIFVTLDVGVEIANLLREQNRIVYCKDCKYWHESKHLLLKGFGACGQGNGIPLKPRVWFCADGERK